LPKFLQAEITNVGPFCAHLSKHTFVTLLSHLQLDCHTHYKWKVYRLAAGIDAWLLICKNTFVGLSIGLQHGLSLLGMQGDAIIIINASGIVLMINTVSVAAARL
jgi:hypothetical protein